MKIFLLLLLTLLPLKTKAWTIYDKNDDKLNLKIEYRFYKDVKEGKYFYWNDLDENYPYSDLDNYYYDEVCKWNNKCEDNGVDLVIKKKVEAIISAPNNEYSFSLITILSPNSIGVSLYRLTLLLGRLFSVI